MCDDVSANKSLFGNERETPSTRSQVIPHAPKLAPHGPRLIPVRSPLTRKLAPLARKLAPHVQGLAAVTQRYRGPAG